MNLRIINISQEYYPEIRKTMCGKIQKKELAK